MSLKLLWELKLSKYSHYLKLKRRKVKAVPSRKASHDFGFAIVTEPVLVLKIPSLHYIMKCIYTYFTSSRGETKSIGFCIYKSCPTSSIAISEFNYLRACCIMYTDPAPPARKGASDQASGVESLVIHSSVPNSVPECLEVY